MARAGVPVTVRARAAVAPERAFDVIVPIDLPRIFTGLGPLPAVTGTREQTGAWDHADATRVVELADGTEARERLTLHERPDRFAYHVGPFTGPLRHLVDGADGAWWFAPTDGGDGGPATAVTWTYTFRPRGLARPLVLAAVAPLWRAYARRALERAVAAAEGRLDAARARA
jgi:hypothetical protein